MIDVCQWRTSIGLWACHQISYSSAHTKDIPSTDNSGSRIDGVIVVRRIRDLTFSLALLLLLLIIISGDVELNPGPKTAKGNSDCFSDSYAAYYAFSANTSNILEAYLDLRDLVSPLFSYQIISDTDYKVLTDRRTGQSAVDRMDHLLKIIRESIQSNGTVFGQFIKILEECGQRGKDLAQKLIKSYRGQKSTIITRPLDPNIRLYRDIMIERYKHEFTLSTGWPPQVGEYFFGRLVLLESQDRYATSQTEQQKAWCMLRGKVDDIPKLASNQETNKLICIQDVLKPSDSGNSLRVIVDGPPGIGKTTLCRKLLSMWTEGELIHGHYYLVLYCPLRNDKVAKAKEIQDLLRNSYECNEVNAVAEHLYKTHGKGFLIVFDGWDELSTDLKQMSLAARIIRRDTLARCSVIVTSRSYASYSLLKLTSINRHVEVIGFSEEEIKAVVRGTLTMEPHLAEKLIQDLRIRSDVQSLCYIPLLCSIVILVYHACGDRRLPTTLTQLYHDFILQAIRRHVVCNTTYDIAPDQIGNLDCLPQSIENISTSFKEMCNFAYQSLNSKDSPKMTFSVPELDQHLPHLNQVNYLGLMTTFTLGGERNYQFLHLSIQEFLAAWWIAKFDCENTDKVFALHFNNDHFRLCLRFVAGLTHLEDKNYQHYFEKELNLYGKKRPFFKLDANYYSWFNQSEFMIGYDNNFMTDDLNLFLLQILYESQNIELCQVLSKSIKDSQLSLRTDKRELSLFDMLCFSYFLKNSNKTWNHLNLWRLNEQSAQMFIDTFANSSQQNCCNIKLKVNLKCPSVTFLQLSFFCNLEELSVDLEDANNFVTFLVELTKLPHLKILHLSSSASKIECDHEDNLFHELENNLEINSTLEDVAIRSESLPCIKSVINGIAGNRTVKSLSLTIWSWANKGKLPENTIEHLLDANHTLKALSLHIDDNIISPLNIINVNTPLTTLEIGEKSVQLSAIPYHARNLCCLVVNLLCPPSYIFPFHPNLQQLDLQLNTADAINKLFSILQTNTTLIALRLQIYNFNEFESIGGSLQCMLACNKTMKCLKIELKMTERAKVPCRFLPTIYLSILTDGLLQNNFLQQLSIEIPLSDTNRNQIKYLFFIMSQKYHLTELDLTFKLDKSYLERYDYHETKGELRWSLLHEHALPLIVYFLDSNAYIRLFKFHFTIFNYGTGEFKAEWVQVFQTFIDAIFDHPSLEYISFPYEILPAFCIDKCRQRQRQQSSPMINMYRGYVQPFFIFKFMAYECYH